MDNLYSVSEIDGLLFKKMLENGFANLLVCEQKVNDMNVFPVPDGDTGTNLKLTLKSGLEHAHETENLAFYVKQAAEGMLLGARGNSGVIVSQIFSGIASSLSGCSVMHTDDFVKALVNGYKTAYSALANPVEGTVLTVAREGTEVFAGYSKGVEVFGKLFEMYLKAMYKSLERTPMLLPKLKEAGVSDSGAYGFILIMEGMSKYLNGEKLDVNAEVKNDGAVDFSVFDKDSTFTYGYCMEFLLRLMSSKTDVSSFSKKDFVNELEKMGTSIVCILEDTIVKVHIHVFNPAPVIELARKYGEFLSFKLENMCLQHNEIYSAVKKEHLPLAVIAPVNGTGIGELFGSFPFVKTIKTTGQMNTSVEEFVNACKTVDADEIIIMPNDRNVTNSALQAVALSGSSNITVIETDSVAQCYYALAMDDGSDVESRIKNMKENVGSVKTVFIAKSTKDVKINDVQCNAGDYVAYLSGKPVCCCKDPVSTVVQALKTIGNFSACFAFTGKNFHSENFEENVKVSFPEAEFSVQCGLQDTYDIILGVIV